MPDQSDVTTNDAVADAVGTVGLIVSVIAVISVALFVAACGLANGAFTVAAGVAVAISFAACVITFMLDATRR